MLGSGTKLRLGDLLVASGEITSAQLTDALDEQKESGQKLGHILVSRGYVEEERLLGFIAEQLSIPFIDLSRYAIDEQLVNRLPETYARRYRAVVLADQGSTLLVGMADPIDIFAYDEVARRLDA